MQYIIALVGPSGSGKSTIEAALTAAKVSSPVLGFATRSPRANEVDGKDVHFVDLETGRDLYNSDIPQKLHYKGHYYGKRECDLEEAFEKNPKAVSCVVAPDGVKQLREYAMRFESMRVLAYFVTAPTDVLLTRILGRLISDHEADMGYDLTHYAERVKALLKEEVMWGRSINFRDTFVMSTKSDTLDAVQAIADDIRELDCAYL